MRRFAFPIVEKRLAEWPTKARCPWCKGKKVLEPHSMAILAGGAFLMDRRKRNGGPSPRMDGFLELIWHGAHDGGLGSDRGIDAYLRIASEVRGGQYTLYFCSTKCLRAFLNHCVDELEGRIVRKRRRSASNSAAAGDGGQQPASTGARRA